MSSNIKQVYDAHPIVTNQSTDLMYFGRSPYGLTDDTAMLFSSFAAQFGAPYTAAALTKTDDTNVTLTLGGTPATALLQAASLTLGWTGTLAPSRGGLGVSTVPTNGQLPIGNGTNYTIAGLTAGTGIGISNGAGSITITNSAPGMATVFANGDIELTANTTTIIDAGASLVTLSFPIGLAVGDTFKIVGFSAGGWQISFASSPVIKIGDQTAAVLVASTNRYDCLTLVFAGIVSLKAVLVGMVDQGALTLA